MFKIKKGIMLVLTLLCMSAMMWGCGQSEEEKLQNKLWDILSDEAMIDVINNGDDTYKVTINYGYGTSFEKFHDVMDLCKENNVTTIYAWFECKQGELKYTFEKNEENYEVTIDGSTYVITEEDAGRVLSGSSPYLISREALNLLYESGFGESFSYAADGNLTITTNEDGWIFCTYDLAQEILMEDDNIETVTYYQKDSGTSVIWKRADDSLLEEDSENITDEDIGDEVVVYEFDTYDNRHIVIDATNIYQQVTLDEVGDYGDVELEIVAPGRDIIYMFDGERYYIEDYSRNLLTISNPID